MPSPQYSYTLDDVIAAVRRRRRVFVYVALPIIAVASGLALTLPDVYRSVARISIDLEGANVQTLEPIQVAAYADQYIAELRDGVLSEDNLLPFVRDSGAFPESEDELLLYARMNILREGFYFALDTQPVTTDYGREVDIITGFRAGFADTDPEFAAKAAKFISESFLREDRINRTERASSTSAFLMEQIAETEAQIVMYEREVADFKVKNACCLPELKELNMAVIQRAERDIEALQPRVRTLEQDRIFLQAQLEEIRKQSISTDRLANLEQEYLSLVANYGPDHPDVARVRREIEALTSIDSVADEDNELTILRMELAEAQRKYSDVHPDVISLKRRIAALENEQSSVRKTGEERLIENPRYLQLRSEINAINTELAELRRRSPELRAKIDDYEQRLARTPQVESDYLALSRKLETTRGNFDNLQQRLVIARQTEALESTEIGARLAEVQAAYIPSSPSAPPRLAIFVLGIFLAGTIGTGSIILAEMLDSTIRSARDIYDASNMVPIATIPVIENSASRSASRRHFVLMTSFSLATVIAIAYVVIAKVL
jgi:uncharacterized protein involved in exopolysaccharide biosynthesis